MSQDLINSLILLGEGMGGIMLVMAAIALLVAGLTRLTRDKQKDKQ